MRLRRILGTVVVLHSITVSMLHAAAATGEPPVFPGVPPWQGRATICSPDGRWQQYRVQAQGGQRQLVRLESTDNGLNWGEPQPLLELPGEGWGGTMGVKARSGAMHLFISRARGQGQPAVSRFIDIWHVASPDGDANWSEPQRVFEGYCGALCSGTELANGRIVVPFGAWIAGRRSGPPTGSNETIVVYSDDNGRTFQQSRTRLTAPCVAGYNGSNYGAIEPSIVQLRDGRIWMLMRTQTGFLYESWSNDGVEWSDAKPSAFFASTGPPYLLRLNDDRIALLWNNCEMPPRVDGQGVYAGRDALHAAIADPECQRWSGFREIFLDPTRNQSPPKTGDRGTAYPVAIPTNDQRIAVVSGQGGRRALMYVDPAWLDATDRSCNFKNGLDDWCVYKQFGPAAGYWRDRVQGAELIDSPSKPGTRVLHVRRPDDNAPDGAVWNFPQGRVGTISITILLPKGSRGATLALGDRFFDPIDENGEAKAMFVLPLELDQAIAGGHRLEPGRTQALDLVWNLDDKTCEVRVDGRKTGSLPLRNPTHQGICYLRIRSTADSIDTGGLMVESVSASIGAAGR